MLLPTCFVDAPGIAPVFPAGTGGRSHDQQLASRCLTSALILFSVFLLTHQLCYTHLSVSRSLS